MLHQDLIEPKFTETAVTTDAGARKRLASAARSRAGSTAHEEVSHPLDSCLFVASVAGNTVAGAMLLGVLLMIPLWLERLITLL